MLTQKTVLVLGAGASVDYGFPLGDGLRKDIIGLTASAPDYSHFVGVLVRLVGIRDPYAAQRFSKDFRDSGLFSIDAYLGACARDPSRGEEVEIGKRALAWVIASREKAAALDKLDRPADSNTEDWYQYLWNQIYLNFQAGTQDLLSIVTFNYDRSLEMYLLCRIMKTFKCAEETAWERLSKIEIIHVYGQLGSLRQYVDGAPDPTYRKYVFDPDRSEEDLLEIERASQMIRVIGDRHNEEVRVRIKELLRAASNICFLGFAYETQNLRVLGFSAEDGWNQHVRFNPSVFICGSAYKRTEAEIYSAAKIISPISPETFAERNAHNAKCLYSLRATEVLNR